MSNFFITSSEILTISHLNNKTFCFNQEELAKGIGCTQPNISYVVGSLLQKGIVENYNGVIVVNQYRLVEKLVEYAKQYYECDLFFQDRVLKLKNCSPELFAYFQTYLRIFNIDYVITECKTLNEICFVFSVNVIDIADID